ncbi:CpaD family pilus assembly protein [Qipengyuania atrilutea]|uniref:CpaD family pilus assembly protein n=1 Tax=Qipengyuania atrilutea TaxID=2744473 RepID=A0A850H0N8_9SPHN|nr:CpaD family pilus assembly protein [Actirhodobacter atriluteus]NVD45461.1 CpaD family pilus assembly protein [Actirhodobacter atriluteus]
MASLLKQNLLRAAALGIGVTLASCGGMPENRSLYSTNQPIVERANYTLDVRSGADGLTINEQRRVQDWFETMGLRYGDRVFVDDPVENPATRDDIAELAARRGILLSEGAPVTSGSVDPGVSRIVVTRSDASVPNCPNWSVKTDLNYTNGVHPNFGCAVNSNIAAMIANPEDLIAGQEGSGETILTGQTRAIDSYRSSTPSGSGGLGGSATQGGE